MLVIRREAALVAAICIATYSYDGAWAGILIVTAALAVRQFGGQRLAAPAAA
jgi:hypothetical protein